MQYTSLYASPLGDILLAADDAGLTGLWFVGQKDFARGLEDAHEARETPLLAEAKRWLDVYFSGREPDFMPPVHLIGTPFQQEVWAILREIPYGGTTTYKGIAARIAQRRGLAQMAAQAVGGAVGRNPISIFVPCHRVIGTNGSLTGYAGGLERKQKLLKLESR